MPIVVPSHRPPGPSVANYPLVTYVNDGIESAMAQAKAAAGDRNVMVHGAYTAQRALEAGTSGSRSTAPTPSTTSGIAFGGALLLRQAVVRPQRTTVEDRYPLSPAPIYTGSKALMRA